MQIDKSLRLLVTSECPYHCTYCHREGMREDFFELLDVNDYEFLMQLLKLKFGINKVSLSGGDPCGRKDIWEIGYAAKKLGLTCVVVTKGLLLKEIGMIDQINFSIDTLNYNLYSKITGVKGKFLDKTITKVVEAKSKRLKVFINTVILEGINDDKKNFDELLAFCSSHKVDEWRLVEKMDVDKPINMHNLYIEDYARKMGIKIDRLPGIQKTFIYKEVPVTLYRCNCSAIWLAKRYIPESLFLSPDGNLLLCMRDDKKIDLLTFIKNRDQNSIVKIIKSINFAKICPVLKRIR